MSDVINRDRIVLSNIDDESLIHELKSRDFLVFDSEKDVLNSIECEDMAEVLEGAGYRVFSADESEFESDEMDEAAVRFRRGDIPVAIVWLERALPDAFSGLSNRVRPA